MRWFVGGSIQDMNCSHAEKHEYCISLAIWYFDYVQIMMYRIYWIDCDEYIYICIHRANYLCAMLTFIWSNIVSIVRIPPIAYIHNDANFATSRYSHDVFSESPNIHTFGECDINITISVMADGREMELSILFEYCVCGVSKTSVCTVRLAERWCMHSWNGMNKMAKICGNDSSNKYKMMYGI